MAAPRKPLTEEQKIAARARYKKWAEKDRTKKTTPEMLEASRKREALWAKGLKTCTECGRDLSLDCFALQKRGLFGRRSMCKVCSSAKQQIVRASDPEKYRVRARKRWVEKPQNAEQRERAKGRAWVYYEANKAKCLERAKKYAKDTKYWHKRRAAFANVFADFEDSEWPEILEEHDHRCAYCLEKNDNLTLDHVIAISRGGPHTRGNIVPACDRCNKWKHAKPVFMMVNGTRFTKPLISQKEYVPASVTNP